MMRPLTVFSVAGLLTSVVSSQHAEAQAAATPPSASAVVPNSAAHAAPVTPASASAASASAAPSGAATASSAAADPTPVPTSAEPAPGAVPAEETPVVPAEPAAERPPAVEEVAPPVVAAPAVASAPSATEETGPPASGLEPSEGMTIEPAHPALPVVLGVMWDVSLPLGSTADFAGNISGRGFALDLRYWGFGKVGVGGAFVWDTMSDKKMNAETVGDVTLSGVAVKELDSSVFVAKVLASPFDWQATHQAGKTSQVPRKVFPYAALGFGGARMVRRIDAGVSRYMDESWHWALVPEIGVEVPTDWVSWMLALRFNYIAGSSDAPEQMFMNFGIGGGF